jgi:hypothetical protein
MKFKAVLNRNKWAVLCLTTRTYYFEGKGKLFCTKKASELNKTI